MNASEPPMTCRNANGGIKTETGSLSQDKFGDYLSIAQTVPGIEVA